MKKVPVFLTSGIAASKTSDKSSYATWLRFFDNGEGSHRGLVLEALFSYWLSRFLLPMGWRVA